MEKLIECYVYDVIRRLPEKERDDVSKELKSNIYDMLPEDADENEIKAILYELGSPASLAEKYRQKPRYLISPAIYDEYIHVLKLVVPLVGALVIVVGMVLGAIDAIGNDMADIPYFIGNILSKGFSLGFSAVFQAVLWITAVFVIIERTSNGAGGDKEQEWKVEDLPEVPRDVKGKIPLSDSIAELVMIVIFSITAFLLCSGRLPFAIWFQDGNLQGHHLFAPSFLVSCIPAIVVLTLFGIGECILKITKRRWTPFVCGMVIVNALVNTGIMLYLLNRPAILHEEFVAFINTIDWGSHDLLRFMGTSVSNPIIIMIGTIIVVCNVAECVTAIYKTMKTIYTT